MALCCTAGKRDAGLMAIKSNQYDYPAGWEMQFKISYKTVVTNSTLAFI
jgi:hypothetical protein